MARSTERSLPDTQPRDNAEEAAGLFDGSAPWMFVVAGPNGAGKTSLTQGLLRSGRIGWLTALNADDRTLALRVADPNAPLSALNLRAA